MMKPPSRKILKYGTGMKTLTLRLRLYSLLPIFRIKFPSIYSCKKKGPCKHHRGYYSCWRFNYNYLKRGEKTPIVKQYIDPTHETKIDKQAPTETYSPFQKEKKKGSNIYTLTFDLSFGWTTCHITCIDFSVCSGSLPPTKVIIAKHSSNWNHQPDSFFSKRKVGPNTRNSLKLKPKEARYYRYRYCLCGFRARFESLRNHR